MFEYSGSLNSLTSHVLIWRPFLSEMSTLQQMPPHGAISSFDFFPHPISLAGFYISWIGVGGGYIVGRVDAEGGFTGPNIAYIYPDHRSEDVHNMTPDLTVQV